MSLICNPGQKKVNVSDSFTPLLHLVSKLLLYIGVLSISLISLLMNETCTSVVVVCGCAGAALSDM